MISSSGNSREAPHLFWKRENKKKEPSILFFLYKLYLIVTKDQWGKILPFRRIPAINAEGKIRCHCLQPLMKQRTWEWSWTPTSKPRGEPAGGDRGTDRASCRLGTDRAAPGRLSKQNKCVFMKFLTGKRWAIWRDKIIHKLVYTATTLSTYMTVLGRKLKPDACGQRDSAGYNLDYLP